MKKYEIIREICLGFLTHNDSYDMLIDPGVGHLEFDGKDIVWVDPVEDRFVSHTQNHAIEWFLKMGHIKEIK